MVQDDPVALANVELAKRGLLAWMTGGNVEMVHSNDLEEEGRW